jgi:hypothetical protein
MAINHDALLCVWAYFALTLRSMHIQAVPYCWSLRDGVHVCIKIAHQGTYELSGVCESHISPLACSLVKGRSLVQSSPNLVHSGTFTNLAWAAV